MMKVINVLVLLLTALPLCSAYLEPPPTTADPSTVSDCSWWVVVASGHTCLSIANARTMSVADLSAYNPVAGTSCALVLGNSYCVERNFGVPVETTTTTNPTGAPGDGISTPQPTQTGMVSNCNKFHKVDAGQVCQQIADLYGIGVGNFDAWNPQVKSDCSGLWANTYVCVGVISYTAPTSTTHED